MWSFFQVFGGFITHLTFMFYQGFISILYNPGVIISAPARWLLSMSIPMRVAVLVAIFQILLVITVTLLRWFNTDLVPLPDELQWSQIGLILGLMFVIPFVVHQALKVWMERLPSQYPEIDYAWEAGLAELKANNINPEEVPIYLVLGTPDDRAERTLVKAARMELRIDQTPQGEGWLHMYANSDAIFITCSSTSCLSQLARQGAKALGSSSSGGRSSDNGPTAGGGGLRDTVVPGAGGGGDDGGGFGGGFGGGDLRGTQTGDFGGVGGGDSLRSTFAGAEEDFGGGGGIRGTMVAPGGAGASGTMSIRGTSMASAIRSGPKIELTHEEASEQQRRLAYLCSLIRRERQPVCPINGVLTLIPYPIVQAGTNQGEAVQRAVRTDLTTLCENLDLRCPVYCLFVGMESESGFRELVRRVGKKQAAARRFGQSLDLWTPLNAVNLKNVGINACGMFEDWVYSLFREKDALWNPGNKRLYAMLCKIRQQFQGRLEHILVGGFLPGEQRDDVKPLLFGGCYFGAAGDEDAQQAFVHGVFDKLQENQGELEWSPRALASEERYQSMARAGAMINVLLVLSLVAMAAYAFGKSQGWL